MKIMTKVIKYTYNILVLLCVTLIISCSAKEQEDGLKSNNNDISDIAAGFLGMSVLEDGNVLQVKWEKIKELSSFKYYKISYHKTGSTDEKSILIHSEDVLETKIPLDDDDQGADYTVNFLGVDKDDKSSEAVSLNIVIPLRVPAITNMRIVSKGENSRTISWDFTPNTATGFTRYSVLYYNEDTPSEVKLKDFFSVNDKQAVLDDIVVGKTYVEIYVIGKEGTLPSVPKLYKLL